MKKVILLLLITLVNSCSTDSDNPSDDSNCTFTPTLFTEDVSSITDTSARFSGQIIAPTCESTVTSQGFVFATTTLPKTDDFVIEVVGENVIADVSDLEPYTTYFMRTFFVNPTGEYYGNQVEFTTSVGQVLITTKEIQNITSNSATSGGIITEDGGANINTRGVCWSTNQQPTINDNFTTSGSGIGSFNSALNNLNELTTYYVRAFATNDVETVYGNEVSFTTPITAVTFDGNVLLSSQAEVDSFGANNYTNVTGYLTIGGDDNNSSDITNLDALISLREVKGVYFLFNDLLSNINGLSNLNTSEDLAVSNCDALTSLDPFINLTSLQLLYIEGNELLVNTDGLNNITSLGNLIIRDNSNYGSNSSLVNLNGLSNVTTISNNLTINNNPNLSNFCGLSSVINNNGLSGAYNVNNNAYNPTQEDILNGNCSN